MALLIEEPGLHTTVQDLGRPGHYNVGIPAGGAMDSLSHEVANQLVGNDTSLATLECTYTGPKFEVTASTVMAVTGADMPISVNGESIPQWTAVELRVGDIVTSGFTATGARAYFAFAGGIEVPLVLGSRGTYGSAKIGGFHGRRLAAGDEVPLGHWAGTSTKHRTLPEALRPQWGRSYTARVVLGPYDHRFTAESIKMFTTQEWKLTPVADRTGFRFDGDHKFEFTSREQPFGAGSDPSNIVDAGYPMGSIQVPGGGQPIVLHRDAVSAGGYAAIATVISADLNRIAQLAPKSTAQFEIVSIDDALTARADAKKHRHRALTSIST